MEIHNEKKIFSWYFIQSTITNNACIFRGFVCTYASVYMFSVCSDLFIILPVFKTPTILKKY